MVTVGLVKELYFIAKILNKSFAIQINPIWDGHKVAKILELKITPDGILDIYYQTHHIWHEKIEGHDSFFGIESCDSISRILNCIDNGSDWQKYSFYQENVS